MDTLDTYSNPMRLSLSHFTNEKTGIGKRLSQEWQLGTMAAELTSSSTLFILLLCHQILFLEKVCVLSPFSCIRLFAALWTVAQQVLYSWDSLGRNTGVGCHALLQGIFPTQESTSLLSPALAGRFFTTSGTWETLGKEHVVLMYTPRAEAQPDKAQLMW